jgi:pimeloyl-ACP methyl ester carboxylesterase
MLNYEIRESSSEQIIFIHGNSQSAKCWEDVFLQQTLQNYTLIAMDLPGHGDSFRSTNADADYSLKGLAKYALDFIKQFESRPYIIVANSLGANIVGEMILQLRNCKGAMLTGSSALGFGLGASEIIMPNPNVGICFAEEFTGEQLNLLIEDCAVNLPEDKKEKIRVLFRKTDPSVRSSLAKCVANQDFSDEIKNMANSKLPLVWVYGEEEKVCFTNALDKLKIPKWKNKSLLIKNSGHFSQLDQPQKLAELITEFAKESFA